MENKKPTEFLFVDETGVSLDPNQPHFGVGGFKINNTINLNRELHDVFTGAISFLQRTDDRFEFKFTYITHRSLKFYKEIINILKKHKDWEFEFILEKKELPWGKTTFWEEYLKYLNLLVKKFSEQNCVLVSDYLSKPKHTEQDLFEIIEQNPSVLNILQLESQGSLFLQVADILLGGVAYQKRIQNGSTIDTLRREISNSVVELLSNKKEQL